MGQHEFNIDNLYHTLCLSKNSNCYTISMSIISIIENHDGNEENSLAENSLEPAMVILERLNSKTQTDNPNTNQNNNTLELQDDQEAYQFLIPGTSYIPDEGDWVKKPSDDDKKSSIDVIDYFIELDRCNGTNLTSDLDDLQRPNRAEWTNTTENPVNDEDEPLRN